MLVQVQGTCSYKKKAHARTSTRHMLVQAQGICSYKAHARTKRRHALLGDLPSSTCPPFHSHCLSTHNIKWCYMFDTQNNVRFRTKHYRTAHYHTYGYAVEIMFTRSLLWSHKESTTRTQTVVYLTIFSHVR